MGSISVLGAVLLLQAQALTLGARVEPLVDHAQRALQHQLQTLLPPPAPTAPTVTEQPPGPEEAPYCGTHDLYPPDALVEASKCRALLLEVIRRAAHDWVLYRSTRRPERAYALNAYVWLFEEEPGHPWWELRQKEGEPLLSFLSICEILDLDPQYVRARIRKMTIRDIMTAGRPAENRRGRTEEGIEDYESPSILDTHPYRTPSLYEESYSFN